MEGVRARAKKKTILSKAWCVEIRTNDSRCCAAESEPLPPRTARSRCSAIRGCLADCKKIAEARCLHKNCKHVIAEDVEDP
jgi:hypothetical protein